MISGSTWLKCPRIPCAFRCGTVADLGSLKFIAVSPLFLQKYRDCEDDVQLLNDGSVWMISDQRFNTIKTVVSYHSELAPNHKKLTSQLSNSIKLGYSNSNMIRKKCLATVFRDSTKTNRQGWMDHSILSEAYYWASSRVGLGILCLSIAELLQTTFGASRIENHKLQGYNTKICFYGEHYGGNTLVPNSCKLKLLDWIWFIIWNLLGIAKYKMRVKSIDILLQHAYDQPINGIG